MKGKVMAILINFLIPLTISTILLYIVEQKEIAIKGKKINKYVIAIALIIPMIVSSQRLIIDIGDSKLYGQTIFEYARENTWSNYYNYFHNNYYAFETGFLLLTFIVAKFTTNYHILFFIFSLINVLLIYDGTKKLKPHINLSIWNALLVFYLLYFGETLNIVRQTLALAIVYWGLHYVFKKEPIKFFIVIFIAMQFHISSALAVVIYVLYYILSKSKNKKVIVGIIVIFGFVLVMCYSKIFLFLKGLNILPSKFFSLYYIDEIPFSPFAVLTKAPLIIIFLVFIIHKGKVSNDDKLMEWYCFTLMCLDLIISQLAGANEDLYRLALIFAYIKIPYFASETNKKLRWFLIFYCLVYFYMEYIYQGALPINMFVSL